MVGCEEKTQLDWEGGFCLRRGFLWEKADQVLWVTGPEVTSVQRGPRGPVRKMEPLPGMSTEGIEYKELFPGAGMAGRANGGGLAAQR